MTIDKNSNILIVGLGLLGGSYAMSLTRQGYNVSAITRRQSSIDYALEHGLISKGTVTVDEKTVSEADIVIFALYPHVFVDWVQKYGKYFKPGVIITDVTGVKSGIVEKIQSIIPETAEFIAAHPMAGREVYGVENSNDEIFRGANYIVTPTEKNTEYATELCKELGRILGFANISVLSTKKHDRMIAFLSQLTHCIAVALMDCNDDVNLYNYTGDSFRDLTRIAMINEEMWTELFILNREFLISEMKTFIGELEKIRRALETDDEETLKKMMRLSTERRKLFNKKQ